MPGNWRPPGIGSGAGDTFSASNPRVDDRRNPELDEAG
jgi:hypothetical protein